MTATLRECADGADAPRTVSRLLSGPPSLARGEPVVAARDPLGLGTHAARAAIGDAPKATHGDHALPQRQAFRLPVCLYAERVAQSGHE